MKYAWVDTSCPSTEQVNTIPVPSNMQFAVAPANTLTAVVDIGGFGGMVSVTEMSETSPKANEAAFCTGLLNVNVNTGDFGLPAMVFVSATVKLPAPVPVGDAVAQDDPEGVGGGQFTEAALP